MITYALIVKRVGSEYSSAHWRSRARPCKIPFHLGNSCGGTEFLYLQGETRNKQTEWMEKTTRTVPRCSAVHLADCEKCRTVS